MAEPQTNEPQPDMIPAPALKEVRAHHANGRGDPNESLLFSELMAGAADTLLAEAGLGLSDEEQARMVAFAQSAGNKAIEAASTHMGLRGWLRFTYDDDKRAARTYSVSTRASWYLERTVDRPSEEAEEVTRVADGWSLVEAINSGVVKKYDPNLAV